jgi:TPP-dependent 2-oxoacid decarboxylase
VYLEIACDMAALSVHGLMPIGSLLELCHNRSDSTSFAAAVAAVSSRIRGSKKLITLCGSKIYSARCIHPFRKFVEQLGCAVAHFPDGKGILNECSDNFLGCYWGLPQCHPFRICLHNLISY